MASIRIKSKETVGGVPSGLTRGELAVNLADKTLYVGAATAGDPAIYLSGVQTFNGLTGAVTGVTVGGANVFTELNTFAGGLSASGATLGYIYTTNPGINNVIVGNVIFTYAQFLPSGYVFSLLSDFQKGISASGATVGTLVVSNGISAAGGITLASPNLTGSPTATTPPVGDSTTRIATTAFVQQEIANEGVTSFNGLTGAVGGVCAAQANTFTALQTFTTGISAAGGITFNSLSHFTQGLSGSGATLGTLVVNSGISASGGVTFHNNVFVGGTLSVQNNISYGGDLIRNGQAVSIISTYGTTSDLPRPGVQGEVAIVSGPIADYGMYLWDGGVSFEFGGVTGAWIRITNQNRYAWNPDADSSGVVDGADLAFLLAAWGEYTRYVAGGGEGDSTTMMMGIGDNLASAFEIKVYGATAGKKTSAFKITSNDAVPQISMNAGTVQMNSDLTISPVGDYTTTISQVTGIIQTGYIHAVGATTGGKGSTFDGNLSVGGLLTLNGGLSAGGATFTAPVYMGATLTMNSNIRFNSGYGITGGFVDAGWY